MMVYYNTQYIHTYTVSFSLILIINANSDGYVKASFVYVMENL